MQHSTFADDTCLFIEVDNRDECADLVNQDLKALEEWTNKWLVTFATTKTKSLTISTKSDVCKNPSVYLYDEEIEEVKSHCYLGITFSYNLRWSNHIDLITSKAQKCLNLMKPLKFKIDRASLECMYSSFVLKNEI